MDELSTTWRHSNRYSVPVDWIGRRVEVRETKDKVEIQLDARRVVTHRRLLEAEHQRVTLAEHRTHRGQGVRRGHPHPEEKTIVAAAPELADYVAGLKQRSRKIVKLALQQLLRFVREYPREPLLGAVREAAHYGLYDLDRVSAYFTGPRCRSSHAKLSLMYSFLGGIWSVSYLPEALPLHKLHLDERLRSSKHPALTRASPLLFQRSALVVFLANTPGPISGMSIGASFSPSLQYWRSARWIAASLATANVL